MTGNTATAEATEESREGVYQGPDETAAGVLLTLEKHVVDYKKLKSELDAADGNRDAALQNYVENSEDAQAVKLREQIANATKRLNDLAEKNVQEIKLSDEDRAKVNTELEFHEGKINASWATAKKVANLLEIDEAGVLAALEKIGNPTKGTRGRPVGSKGASVPRASVNIVVNGGTFKDQQFDTFSAMSKALNCDVEYLSKEFAVAAGVDYQDISSVDSDQTFQVQPKEDGPKYSVKTTPKQRKPRSKNSDATVTTTEQTDGPTAAPDFSDESQTLAGLPASE